VPQARDLSVQLGLRVALDARQLIGADPFGAQDLGVEHAGAALAERGATSPPSQANFLLAKVGDRAPTLRASLAQAGIIVRDGAGVGFPGHLRISIGTREQNDRLLAAWDRAFAP